MILENKMKCVHSTSGPILILLSQVLLHCVLFLHICIHGTSYPTDIAKHTWCLHCFFWYDNRVDILGLMGCTENLQEDLSFQCVYMNLFSDHLKGFNEVNLPEPLWNRKLE